MAVLFRSETQFFSAVAALSSPQLNDRSVKMQDACTTGLYLSNFIGGGVEVLAIEVDDRANA